MINPNKDFLKYNPDFNGKWVHSELNKKYAYLSKDKIADAGLVCIKNLHCIKLGMVYFEYFHEYQRDQDWNTLQEYGEALTVPQDMLKKYGITLPMLYHNFVYLFGSRLSWPRFKLAYLKQTEAIKMQIRILIAFRYTIRSDTYPTIEEFVNPQYATLEKTVRLFGDIFLDLPARGLGFTAEKTNSKDKPK
ncbi:hypothetical protein N9893_02955 [bacterium]|nr:hypothetical protein [bacterium]